MSTAERKQKIENMAEIALNVWERVRAAGLDESKAEEAFSTVLSETFGLSPADAAFLVNASKSLEDSKAWERTLRAK